MNEVPMDKFSRYFATAFTRNVGNRLDGELISNALLARQELLSSLIDPRRDIDAECHYPATQDVTPEQYKQLYDRDPIANRIVQCLPKECWQVQPFVYEAEDPEVRTPFEEAWDALQPTTGGVSWYKPEAAGSVWEYLERIDILSGIGHFGVLLMGFDDGKNLQEPVDGAMVVNSNPEGHNQYTEGTAVASREEFRVGKRRVIRNPTDGDIQDLVREFRDKYPMASGPKVRSTYDDRGNKYSWMSDSTHADIEPSISRKYGVRTDQNKYFTKNSLQPIPDCYLTKQEEDNIREFCNNSNYKLNEQEELVLKQLSRQREFIVNAMQEQQARRERPWQNPVFGQTSDEHDPTSMTGVKGTDRQYSQEFGLRGEATYSPGLSGTDQQYFGVQFGPSEQPVKQPSKKKLKLLFLRPFDESLVQVVRYEWNINNPRFGMPVMYRITLNDPREQHSGIGLPMATVFVHWTRVLHVNDTHDTAGSSEIFSPPRMRPNLNRLLDLQKIYGASAEGYWQAAFTGLSLETHPQLGGDVTIDGADVKNQIENYVNSLQRYLALTGMSAHTLAPQVSDPASQIDKHLEAICIQKAIPKRVFMGSERGELASSQDDASWNDRLKSRQLGYITPRIVVPFIDRLIAVGVLPEPNYVEPVEEEEDYGDDYGAAEEEDELWDEDDFQGRDQQEEGDGAFGDEKDQPEGEVTEGEEIDDQDRPVEEDGENLIENAFDESKHPRADDGKFEGRNGEGEDSGRSLSSIADEHSKSGEEVSTPGQITVAVYRVGSLDNPHGRGVFYGDSEESVKPYEGLHPGEKTKRYVITAKNPIVTRSHFSLYKFLFPGKGTLQDAIWKEDKKSGFKSSTEAFRRVEVKMAKVAKKKGHDAIVYTSPPAPANHEIAVINQVLIINRYPTSVINAFDEDGNLIENVHKHAPILNASGDQIGVKTATGYSVVWPDLDSNTDLSKAQIASTKTQALATYVSGNVEAVMPLTEFYTRILGMTDEEAKSLVKAAEAQQAEMELEQAEQQQFGDQYEGMQDGQDQFGQEQPWQDVGEDPVADDEQSDEDTLNDQIQ